MRSLDVWLINPYGPIPGEGWRDYRFALIGKTLAASGHRAIWWTANFSHHFKRFRSKGWEDREVVPGFTVRLVPTAGYRKNISVGRLRFQSRFAANLIRRGMEEKGPDVIIGVDPPQPIGTASVKLAQHHGAKLVLDVMDQWPELFALALPAPLRPFAGWIFRPWYRARARNMSAADAITALAETYLEVGRSAAPAARSKPHMTAFNGIDVEAFRRTMSDETIEVPPLPVKGDRLWAIYAGTLGDNYDVDGIMRAAIELRNLGSRVTILVAGSGPRRDDLTRHIADEKLENLVFLGKLDHDVLIRLYTLCDIGISPYGPHSNVAMPDKAYDYMAAGLPIVNSLIGELAQFIAQNGVGLQYRAGDGKDLARVLQTLATDDEARRGMATASWAEGIRFDARAQYAQFVDLLQRIA